MIPILLSNRLVPVLMRWCCRRDNARPAPPIWLRRARPLHAWQRSTPPSCFSVPERDRVAVEAMERAAERIKGGTARAIRLVG